MLLTRETDYAIRTVRALSDGEFLTAGQICERESIPTQFAYKILKKLSNVGLISISRGALGGYRLNSPLDKITLYDVIKATDEEICVNECLQCGYHCVNNCNEKVCCFNRELRRVQDVLNKELSSRSIAEIMTHSDSSKISSQE